MLNRGMTKRIKKKDSRRQQRGGQSTTLISVSTIANGGFSNPSGVTIGPNGIIYIADTNNNCIKMISTGGAVSRLAGSGANGFSDGTGASAVFNNPVGLIYSPADGVIYVVDQWNHRIRRVTLPHDNGSSHDYCSSHHYRRTWNRHIPRNFCSSCFSPIIKYTWNRHIPRIL